MSVFESELEQRLSGFVPRKMDTAGREEASVLISLFSEGRRPGLLLTKRSERLTTYQGQISFPGGRREPEDATPVATALREANEELGIPPEKIKVLGEFNDYLSKDGMVVHTIPGFLEDTSRFRLQDEEVECLIRIPLEFFIDNPPRSEIRERNGSLMEIHFYDYQEIVVWGLTAHIIKHFVDELL